MDWPQVSSQESQIDFFSEEIDYNLSNPNLCKDWLLKIISKEQKSASQINIIFCSDSFLLNKNQEYLNHDTFTDIITFQYNSEILSGDIFISIDRVKENATSFGISFEDELARVMAHGVLHLCGYKDKTEEEKKEIRQKENMYLAMR